MLIFTQLFSDGDFEDIREIALYAFEEKMQEDMYSYVEKQEVTIEDKWGKLFISSEATKADTLFGNLTDCEKRQVLQGDWDICPLQRRKYMRGPQSKKPTTLTR